MSEPTMQSIRQANEQLIKQYKEFAKLTYSYGYTLNYFLTSIGSKPLTECNEIDVQKFLNERAHTNGSWNNMLATVRGLYKWLYNKDTRIPRRKWKAPEWFEFIDSKKVTFRYTEKDVWSEEEIGIAISARDHPRDKALISVGYDLAARPHELMSLKRSDIIMKPSYGEVRLKDHSNPEGRLVQITISYPYLLTWLNCHPLKDETDYPLWVSVKGIPGRIGPAGLTTLIRGLKKQLGDKIHRPFNAYCMFSHSRLSNLAEEDGVNQEDLRWIRGWSVNSRMPKRYIHPNGRGTKRRLLELAGIELDGNKGRKESALKPKKCYKCQQENPVDAKFCKCGFALSAEGYEEVKKQESDLRNDIQELKEHSQLQQQSIDKILTILNVAGDAGFELRVRSHKMDNDGTVEVVMEHPQPCDCSKGIKRGKKAKHIELIKLLDQPGVSDILTSYNPSHNI